MADWVAVMEACYDLSGELDQWLERLIDRVAPALELGHGATALTFRLAPTQFSVGAVAVRGSAELEQFARASNSSAAPEAIDLVYRSGVPAATLSEVVFSRIPAAADAFAEATNGVFRDAFGIVAHSGSGSGVALTAPIPEIRTMTRAERRRWTQVTAHVGAGLRLREQAGRLAPEDDRVEALLDPAGRMLEASGSATSDSSRERLRRAVLRAAEARAARRSDPDRSLQLWEGLVRGRWSLVDVFDADGRRYVAAVPNDPRVGDPRGLSVRELQVAEFCGLGRSVKEIGYLLGLAPSTVSAALDRVQRKLGLASKADVAAFFAPSGVRARLQEVDVTGTRLLVGSLEVLDEDKLVALTDTERGLVELLLSGATNRAVAELRSVSERTVANQVQSIYRKLGVRSRVELALWLVDQQAATS